MRLLELLLLLLLPAPSWSAPLATVAVIRPYQPPVSAYGPGHRGIDLAGQPGEVVRSAGSGRVRFAGPIAGVEVVSVDHGHGMVTTYEPVTPSVRRGQVVDRSTPIGLLLAGHPGCPVAACLHWGFVHDGSYTDPMALLGRGPVRLVPP